MDCSTAIRKAHELQLEWVGEVPVSERLNGVPAFDLDRIHASMLQEHRWNRLRPARCTPACAADTFGKLILLGKVKKALAAGIVGRKRAA